MSQPIFSIQSGQGALMFNKKADQTGNLLNTDPLITTVAIPIGKTEVNGILRRRYGNVAKGGNEEFQYPKGPPGVYASTVPGYEGKGNLGDGSYNMGGHHHVFHYSEDLLEAQGIVQRDVLMEPHFGKAQHRPLQDQRYSMVEDTMIQMENIKQEEKVRDLLAKGFTSEEIVEKHKRDRIKAIESMDKITVKDNLLKTAIAQMKPKEILASPGVVPAKRDTTAFERAVHAGSFVNRQKAYEAINREHRIEKGVAMTEEPIHVPEEKETIEQVLGRISRSLGSASEKIHEDQEKVKEEQHLVNAAEENIRKNIIKGTMGRKKGKVPKKTAIERSEDGTIMIKPLPIPEDPLQGSLHYYFPMMIRKDEIP